jgi:hypothetical protein
MRSKVCGLCAALIFIIFSIPAWKAKLFLWIHNCYCLLMFTMTEWLIDWLIDWWLHYYYYYYYYLIGLQMGFTRWQWYCIKAQHRRIHISCKIKYHAETKHSTQSYTYNKGHITQLIQRKKKTKFNLIWQHKISIPILNQSLESPEHRGNLLKLYRHFPWENSMVHGSARNPLIFKPALI